jgi:uncharacterized protein (TIGR03000 family)
MYSLVLLAALAPAPDLPAFGPHCHRRVHCHPCPPVCCFPCPPTCILLPAGQPQAPADADAEAPDPQPAPPTDAERRVLDDLRKLVPDPADRDQLTAYWNDPEVTPVERKEYYTKLLTEAGVEVDWSKFDPPAPARFIVELPADARLWVGDWATTSTSARREFTSPPLEPGEPFHYDLVAQVVRGGRLVTLTGAVTVRAGQTSSVRLDEPDSDPLALK